MIVRQVRGSGGRAFPMQAADRFLTVAVLIGRRGAGRYMSACLRARFEAMFGGTKPRRGG